MVFSGTSPDDRLVEIIELPEHPFFVAAQFHPEFKSRPLRPQPLFREFVRASIDRSNALRADEAQERDEAEIVEPTGDDEIVASERRFS
jgi:CTP synthase